LNLIIVATRITTETTKENKLLFSKYKSRHHNLLWKIMRKLTKRNGLQNWIRVRLYRGKVLAPYNVCPKTVPLIE